MVQITPEMQQQINEMKKNCIFCKIIKGEMPCKQVYSDEKIFGVLDINPWTKGHVLIMPKEHYPIMPYIPADTFKHLFGILPKIVSAIKKAVLSTGANVIIANGAVAGQQSPHFLFHIIPREKQDRLINYSFDQKKNLDTTQLEPAKKLLSQNIPLMMQNHFRRNPAQWRQKNFTGNIYEDEKVKVTTPENPACIGHLKIESKECTAFDEMDFETANHIFFTASFCATAVFEGLGAHGTNIILKTGISDDNNNELSIHVLPRYENDGLELMGTPMQNKPNLDAIASQIKEETFYAEHEAKEQLKKTNNTDQKKQTEKFMPKNSIEKEIHDSINAIKKN